MGAAMIPSDGTRGELRHPPPYSAEEYILLHIPKIVVRRFAIMPTGVAFVMRAGIQERESAFAGCFKRRKHWEGRPASTVQMHAAFIAMPFTLSYEEFEYEGLLASLMRQLCANAVVPNCVSLDLLYAWCDLHKAWFVDNHAYWVKYIFFEIHSRQPQEEQRRLRAGWHNLKLLAEPPVCPNAVFVSVSGWGSCYVATRLLYLPNFSVFLYCIGVFKSF